MDGVGVAVQFSPVYIENRTRVQIPCSVGITHTFSVQLNVGPKYLVFRNEKLEVSPDSPPTHIIPSYLAERSLLQQFSLSLSFRNHSLWYRRKNSALAILWH